MLRPSPFQRNDRFRGALLYAGPDNHFQRGGALGDIKRLTGAASMDRLHIEQGKPFAERGTPDFPFLVAAGAGTRYAGEWWFFVPAQETAMPAPQTDVLIEHLKRANRRWKRLAVGAVAACFSPWSA